MEGKTVVLSVLIMSLVMAQIQVEAWKCCPSMSARFTFNTCIISGFSVKACEKHSGCIIISSGKCPDGYENDILEKSGDAVDEYCKLGCASSVCGALTTLQNSDASEIVNGAVEQCTKACSNLCTKGKGSVKAVGTA